MISSTPDLTWDSSATASICMHGAGRLQAQKLRPRRTPTIELLKPERVVRRTVFHI
ncbi:hypothetical protein SBA1_720020 [Candidatus Sulfotelmatobacter kueseliae]|uniref:Uncharacterized protein n=1 Tax=Candidatus Sulfotelmatobacter kueseliae TaxID=2042962 RepID=A0A2U3L650_9BACT|nr:hypothetical protein SBA1_720020 [Candidatus Sulfotelmatobacter kueseliae]